MEKFKGMKWPWRINEKFGQIQSSDGLTIIISFGKSATKIDKQLIAAAPELLEALINLSDLCEANGTNNQWTHKAKIAIAKALGTPINETDPITQSNIETDYSNSLQS